LPMVPAPITAIVFIMLVWFVLKFITANSQILFFN